jgi:glycosyltransferase involved in cell wall biosynthesis
LNRLLAVNMQGVTPESLPPADGSDRVRMLFLSGVSHGFRRYHERLVRYVAQDDQIDAVHIELVPSLIHRALGKRSELLGPSAWDFHGYRYLWLWRREMNRWFRDRLPLDRFDVVHIMTQGMAWSIVDQPRRDSPAIALNIDATAELEARELGASRLAKLPFIRAERAMFAIADLIICRNRWCARSLTEDYGVPEDKIFVAPNSLIPPPLPEPGTLPRLPGELPKLVFVGNDFNRKGGPELVQLHQRRFVDRAELHVFSSKAKIANARNVVLYRGVPNLALVRRHLPLQDIFILPTTNDMMPNALMEAAVMQLPIIATRLAGIPDIVLDGQTGILCAPNEWEAFGDAIERLLNDEELRRRMGRAGREHMVCNFHADRVMPALLARLKSLHRGGAGG